MGKTFIYRRMRAEPSHRSVGFSDGRLERAGGHQVDEGQIASDDPVRGRSSVRGLPRNGRRVVVSLFSTISENRS